MLDVILGNPILLALAALVGMAIAFGALLGFAAVRFEVEGNPLSIKSMRFAPDPMWSVWLPWMQALRRGHCRRRLNQQVPSRR